MVVGLGLKIAGKIAGKAVKGIASKIRGRKAGTKASGLFGRATKKRSRFSINAYIKRLIRARMQGKILKEKLKPLTYIR